jgi:hypothetical protein
MRAQPVIATSDGEGLLEAILAIVVGALLVERALAVRFESDG